MSLFAWKAANASPSKGQLLDYSGIFAHDPSEFEHCTDIIQMAHPMLPTSSWTITNAGLEMKVSLCFQIHADDEKFWKHQTNLDRLATTCTKYSRIYVLKLRCARQSQRVKTPSGIGIFLQKVRDGYARYAANKLFDMSVISIQGSNLLYTNFERIRDNYSRCISNEVSHTSVTLIQKLKLGNTDLLPIRIETDRRGSPDTSGFLNLAHIFELFTQKPLRLCGKFCQTVISK